MKSTQNTIKIDLSWAYKQDMHTNSVTKKNLETPTTSGAVIILFMIIGVQKKNQQKKKVNWVLTVESDFNINTLYT